MSPPKETETFLPVGFLLNFHHLGAAFLHLPVVDVAAQPPVWALRACARVFRGFNKATHEAPPPPASPQALRPGGA